MNIILRNALISCAVIGVCFGLGRGVKWIQNHDWNSDDNDQETMQYLIRRLDRLEEGLNRVEREQDRFAERSSLNTIRESVENLYGRVNDLKSTQELILAYRNDYNNNDDDNDDDDEEEEEVRIKPTKGNYAGKSCHSQQECGGKNSGYFCNYGGMHTKNVCEKTNPLNRRIDGVTYYYNKSSDLKKWCRTATESAGDRAYPDNCNWGYLSYHAAQAWCESIGKKLVDSNTIHDDCKDFYFLPKAYDDQQYWTTNQSVVHMGQECSIQNMVRGDGYWAAGGVICR